MFESWPEMWGGGYPAYRTTLRKFLWFRTVTGGNAPEFKTVTGKIVSFLTHRIAPLKIEADLEPIQSGTGDPSPDNVRPITGHTGADIYVEDEYDAQADPTVQISFGSTVYGGTLTVNEDGSGTVVAEKAKITLDDRGEVNWQKSTSYPGGFYMQWTWINTNYGVNFKLATPFICSHAKTALSTSEYLPGTCFSDSSCNIRIMTAATTKTEWCEYLAEQKENGTPVEVCGTLVNSVAISLTPGQVNALLGNNTVWVDDSDNISVTYQSN